jgi:type II secretory pathway component GspD/PulD (secretin)
MTRGARRDATTAAARLALAPAPPATTWHDGRSRSVSACSPSGPFAPIADRAHPLQSGRAMKTLLTSRASLVAVLALAAMLTGCSSSTAATSRDPASAAAPPRPPASTVEGIHAVRIPLRSRDARQVSGVLRELLGLPHDRDVRAILDEPSTDSLVVVGTDAGIARVRSLLSPALVGGEEDAGIDVVTLQHAEAHRLLHAVEEVAPGDVRLVVDEATNSLVVSGPVASRQKVLALARVLDAPGG